MKESCMKKGGVRRRLKVKGRCKEEMGQGKRREKGRGEKWREGNVVQEI